MVYKGKGVMLLHTRFSIFCTKACLNHFVPSPFKCPFSGSSRTRAPVAPELVHGEGRCFAAKGAAPSEARARLPYEWLFCLRQIFFEVVSTF